MRKLFAIAVLLVAGTAQAADRVAYAEREVVAYIGGKATVVSEKIAVVVSDPVIVKAAPVVAARTFRNGDYHASHSCPVCGRSQFVIHSGSKGGGHTHQCRYDGTVWRH